MRSRILLVAFLITYTIGANAMSFFNNDKEMYWEWPADRPIKYKVVVEVIKLKSIFKLFNSPSFNTYLPDPVLLRAKVIKGDLLSENETIKLELPKDDIEVGISKGTKVVFGMVNESTVVCVKTIPTNLSDTKEIAWLENLVCK